MAKVSVLLVVSTETPLTKNIFFFFNHQETYIETRSFISTSRICPRT